MVLGLLLVAAVVIGGLYVFVPQVHTAILNAWTVARDDLTKIEADGHALVARLEAHAQVQTKLAGFKTAEAEVAVKVANIATATAASAKTAAAALKSAVTDVSKV